MCGCVCECVSVCECVCVSVFVCSEYYQRSRRSSVRTNTDLSEYRNGTTSSKSRKTFLGN